MIWVQGADKLKIWQVGCKIGGGGGGYNFKRGFLCLSARGWGSIV